MKGKPVDYPETVSTTWEFSLKKIAEESESAADLMNIFAFLGPDVMPIKALREGASFLPENLSAVVSEP